jgi:hypothetical protein
MIRSFPSSQVLQTLFFLLRLRVIAWFPFASLVKVYTHQHPYLEGLIVFDRQNL